MGIGACLSFISAASPSDLAVNTGYGAQLDKVRVIMALANEQATLSRDDNSTPPAQLLEAIVESLPNALVVFDRQLKVILSNHPATPWFQIGDDVTKALSSLAAESTYEDWASELRKVIDSGSSKRLDITIPQTDDQPELFLDVVIQPLKGTDRGTKDGQATGGLLLAEDISSRVSMERRLAVSERLAAVGKMAARVAHELNNPLDGIQRYTNLALRLTGKLTQAEQPLTGESADKLSKYLNNAKSGIARMGEIITSLLEFSRNTPNTFEQATINHIVEDAITAMEGRARTAGVTIICNFHQADMPVVRGSNIFQVFCNLIKNAIDAMSDGGTLTIITKTVGSDVVATFEDTGDGLPEEIERIFDPFFTTKAPGKGTGLGLAVCKELIEKYEGKITAERREPHGTRMIVTIPIENCAATPLPKHVRRHKKSAKKELSVHNSASD